MGRWPHVFSWRVPTGLIAGGQRGRGQAQDVGAACRTATGTGTQALGRSLLAVTPHPDAVSPDDARPRPLRRRRACDITPGGPPACVRVYPSVPLTLSFCPAPNPGCDLRSPRPVERATGSLTPCSHAPAGCVRATPGAQTCARWHRHDDGSARSGGGPGGPSAATYAHVRCSAHIAGRVVAARQYLERLFYVISIVYRPGHCQGFVDRVIKQVGGF